MSGWRVCRSLEFLCHPAPVRLGRTATLRAVLAL